MKIFRKLAIAVALLATPSLIVAEPFHSFSYDQAVVIGTLQAKGIAASNLSGNNGYIGVADLGSQLHNQPQAALISKPDHATALFLYEQSGNKYALHNDPMGAAIPAELRGVLEVYGYNVTDARIRIQQGGNDCGVLTVDTIMELAAAFSTNPNINTDQIRQIITQIGQKDVITLRKEQLLVLLNSNDDSLQTRNARATNIFHDRVVRSAGEKANYTEADLLAAIPDLANMANNTQPAAPEPQPKPQAQAASAQGSRPKPQAQAAGSQDPQPQQAVAVPTIVKTLPSEIQDAITAADIATSNFISSSVATQAARNVTNLNNFRLAMPVNILVAAGDEGDLTYGLWLKGALSKANLKSTNSKLSLGQQALTIGFDIGDEHVIGTSYSLALSNLTDCSSGNNKRYLTHIGSLYGSLKIASNLFVNGQLYYGQSNEQKAAIIKSNGQSFTGGVFDASYVYSLSRNNFAIVPKVGLSGIKIKAGEGKGRIYASTSIKTDKIEAIKASAFAELGLRKKFKFSQRADIFGNGYVRLEQNIQDSGREISGLLNGTEKFMVKQQTIDKTMVSCGAAVSAELREGCSLEIGSDLSFGKGSAAISGFATLRVAF